MRIVSHFSCGAASAVAAKLAIAKYGHDRVLIVNAFIAQEHKDNRRFLADCERWLDHPITVLRNEKYGASTDTVWMQRRYLNGPHGAPGSKHLKRDVLETVRQPGDVDVIGYTVEEEDRLEELQRLSPDRLLEAPLIEKGLDKADCLAMVERAGIALPMMYLLGGLGYWNKVRDVFPERFYEIASIEASIGPGAYIFRNRETGERFPLTELPRGKGNYPDEPEIQCSFFCQMAEQDIAGSA